MAALPGFSSRWLLLLALAGCGGGATRPRPVMGGAPGDDTGGVGGSAPSADDASRDPGGGAGAGGRIAPDAGIDLGGGPVTLADAAVNGVDASAPSATPPGTSQGPVAEGKIAFSQDFEQNMNGMSRSPASLPVDRIQIVDDPVGQRGKVVRITFEAGDDFRTSPGTQPRSWFSSSMGYTVKPGTTVSVAWGFMWENVAMNAHFAQLIRDGGPTWMWDVDANGNLSMTFHRGTGATGTIMKVEPMKWYDFMVTTHYVAGGETRFYVNGKMVLVGQAPGGPDGRFDFGIYTRPGDHPARTVYLSNVSIGEP